MSRKPLYRLFLFLSGFVLVVPIKCNSIFAPRGAAVDDGYEYVTVLGSNVPQRVKKGQAVITASPVDILGGDAVRDYSQKSSVGTVGSIKGAKN